jgi:hydrogenase maturation protease
VTPPVLVACVGNIFKSDDGFGVEVAARLAQRPLPDGVRVVDFGIRSVHLVYELLSGYDVLVLVDTVSRQDGPPGSLYVLEPDLPPRDLSGQVPQVVMDAHDLSPGAVMTLIPVLGGHVDRIVVVGCTPASLEDGIGLSPEVSAATEPAVSLVRDVVARELKRLAVAGSRAVRAGTETGRGM